MQGATIAVTGATGLLGSAVAAALREQGARVRALVRREGLVGYDVYLGDLKTGGWPVEAFRGADAVVHCAASIGGPLAHQRTVNRDGTRLVAEQSTRAGVDRFVHVSSVAVYGYRGTEFPETRPMSPSRQDYSTTKAEAEEMLADALPEATVIRPGGLFGPGADFWSAAWVRRAKRRLAFNIGRGQGTLPVIFIDDIVDLITTALVDDRAVGQVLNCCLDPAPTWREYQRAYGALVGSDRWIALPTSLGRGAAALVSAVSKSGTNASVVDELLAYAMRPKRFPMDKARELLGWQPNFSLHEAVRRTEPWLDEQGILA